MYMILTQTHLFEEGVTYKCTSWGPVKWEWKNRVLDSSWIDWLAMHCISTTGQKAGNNLMADKVTIVIYQFWKKNCAFIFDRTQTLGTARLAHDPGQTRIWVPMSMQAHQYVEGPCTLCHSAPSPLGKYPTVLCLTSGTNIIRPDVSNVGKTERVVTCMEYSGFTRNILNIQFKTSSGILHSRMWNICNKLRVSLCINSILPPFHYIPNCNIPRMKLRWERGAHGGAHLFKGSLCKQSSTKAWKCGLKVRL